MAKTADQQPGARHDPLPRHRPEGRPVRPAAARRDGGGHRLRRRPGRPGAQLPGGGLRMAAPGRPERRLRRQPGERARRSRRSSPASPCPAQLGGGIRDMATIAMWLEKGLARVILGTVAVENPALVREAARAFPGQVAVGIDARKGRVATKGWADGDRRHGHRPCPPASRTPASPRSSTPTSTATARCRGPNIEATEALARAVTIPVIASGGVSRWPTSRALNGAAGRRSARRDLGRGRSYRRGASSLGAALAAPDAGLRCSRPAIIPCLDVADGRVVKGVNFVDLIDAGDPVEAARPMTPPARTSSASSTSCRPTKTAARCSTSSPAPPSSASCR